MDRRLLAVLALVAACSSGADKQRTASVRDSVGGNVSATADSAHAGTATAGASSTSSERGTLAQSLNGRIPGLEYHVIGGDKNSLYSRTAASYKADLDTVYKLGFRPITVAQMLYKDFASPGSGTIAFRLRADLSTSVEFPATGWFNPDPTSAANLVLGPADSIMVYVGSPNETVYDTNRRWFSEVLDLSKPMKEIFVRSGKIPVAGTDSSLSIAYAGVQPVGGSVRVVADVTAEGDGFVTSGD